jgi:hypothetical protein
MMTTTVRVVADFREKRVRDLEAMSIGELLYWVMFGDVKLATPPPVSFGPKVSICRG